MVKKINKYLLQRGAAAQLPIIIGLILLGVALPAALRLVQQQQEVRHQAAVQLDGSRCVGDGGECMSAADCLGGRIGEYYCSYGYKDDCPEGTCCCLPIEATPTLAPTLDCNQDTEVRVSDLVTDLPLEQTLIEVEAPTGYINVEIRVTDVNGNITPYQNPEVNNIPPYVWQWTIQQPYEDIIRVDFYINVSSLGEDGEVCGSWRPSVVGGCNTRCFSDDDCDSGLICYQLELQPPRDDLCGDYGCAWCGNICTFYTPGQMCPDVMPPEDKDCVCLDGECVEVPSDGVVMGETTGGVCRNPDCPQEENCVCPDPITPGPGDECKPCPDGSFIESKADYNCDGVVNLSDFSAWYRDYLSETNQLYADFNCDGVVDELDFAQWYDEFNLHILESTK